MDEVEEESADIGVGGVAGGVGGAAGEDALQQLVEAAVVVQTPQVLGAHAGVDHGASDPVGEQAHVGQAEHAVGRQREQVPLPVAERPAQRVEVSRALGGVVGGQVDASGGQPPAAGPDGAGEVRDGAAADERL